MRLRRLMGVADQIVASRFSSIDLSNKAFLVCSSIRYKGNAITACYLCNMWWLRARFREA